MTTASREAIKALSGRERASAVRRWLDRERIPYILDADNWPVVLDAIITQRLGGQAAPPTPEPRLRLRHG